MANTAKALPEPEMRIYDVELSTLLGKRTGSLKLQFSGERFSGVLSLMRAENPVHGQVSREGLCSMDGSIRTRMNTYPFAAEGLMLPERIELLLRCAGFSLPLCGTRKEE